MYPNLIEFYFGLLKLVEMLNFVRIIYFIIKIWVKILVFFSLKTLIRKI